MAGIRDRFQRMVGKTRFVVCRIMLHLTGADAAPLLGTFNQVARKAVEAEGDLTIVGEGLVDICQSLLEYRTAWKAAANEGDFFWDEGEAGDYFTELFTDSAQRYLSSGEVSEIAPNEPLTLPVTRNLVVMLAIAYEGQVPDLELDLVDFTLLTDGLKALINLHYQNKLRAIQVHYSPAQFGDELTDEQVLANFPELIPL
jgi:hypothetical protein